MGMLEKAEYLRAESARLRKQHQLPDFPLVNVEECNIEYDSFRIRESYSRILSREELDSLFRHEFSVMR